MLCVSHGCQGVMECVSYCFEGVMWPVFPNVMVLYFLMDFSILRMV